jgi:hypothetical protein
MKCSNMTDDRNERTVGPPRGFRCGHRRAGFGRTVLTLDAPPMNLGWTTHTARNQRRREEVAA